jgi:non-homologous end joining protein Ku
MLIALLSVIVFAVITWTLQLGQRVRRIEDRVSEIEKNVKAIGEGVLRVVGSMPASFDPSHLERRIDLLEKRVPKAPKKTTKAPRAAKKE